MTVATFAGTLPAIARTQDHRYIFEGVTVEGVTGILKVLDKSDGLLRWAANEAVDAALEMFDSGALSSLVETVGKDGARKALTDRSTWKRDTAAQLGTEVHRLADLVVQGQPTPPMEVGIRERVLAYADWWQRSGWTLRLSEACVFEPPSDEGTVYGYGGTFDLLARDGDGRTVLADIKTGKGIYREAILQLAAYGMAKLVSPWGAPAAYPMPAIDRYVVLHVTTGGVREVELAIGTAERMAFLACQELHEWTKTVRGKL